jgi:hypothetical protein
MLTDRSRRGRRNSALVLTVLTGGILLAVLIGAIFVHDDGGASGAVNGATRTALAARSARMGSRRGSSATADTRTGASKGPVSRLTPASAGSTHPSGAEAQPRRTLEVALSSGVSQADALGGEAAAAVWIAGDRQPVLSGPTSVPHRMWSMSKAVVTVAALQAVRNRPDPVLRSAIADAITRSDNCAIRRVIVGLQDRLNQGTEGTIAAFERALATADARIERSPQLGSAEQACLRYLNAHQGGLPGSDLGVVPQFGTAEWTEYDAISFAHALSAGVYGAPGAYLLQAMSVPKQPPLEEPPPPSAPPLDWGAGAAFPVSWQPAWKAGWGGSQDRPPHYLAGQLVVLRLGDVPVAVTAIFVPRAEPVTDNPGITQAPRALETMFAAARLGLERERLGDSR